MSTKRRGYDTDEVEAVFFTGAKPPTVPAPGTLGQPTPTGDGTATRDGMTGRNDGTAYRQVIPSRGGGMGRVHSTKAPKPEKKRVELRIDTPLFDLLTAEAAGAGVSINEAMTQILNLYFKGAL